MVNELVKEKIILEQNIGKEVTQVMIEGDIIVSDIKPDISVILQTESKVCIDRVDVSTDRVNFMGRLDIQVLYLSKGSDKTVHSMSQTSVLEDFINMDSVTKEMFVEVKANLANVNYEMINDRKVNYRAVIDVEVSAQSHETHEIIVDIKEIPENQLLKTGLNLNRCVEKKSDKFITKDELTIPSGKPNIREILQCSVVISSKEVKVGNGKVSIIGELNITTLYRGDADSSLIEFTEHEVPFNGAIEISGVREDMQADVTLTSQDQYVQVRPDADGEDRVIEIEVSVDIMAKVHCQENLQILEDAHCINKNLDIEKTKITCPKLICRNKNQFQVKEIVQLNGDCPDILQIFKVKGNPFVDEIKVIDDKVIVEGIIESSILYVAENDETPLYSFNTYVPFHQIIETKGARMGMEVVLDVGVDHVGFNMMTGREMELRFLLNFNAQVVEKRDTNMITSIEFSEMEKSVLENMSSMTVYVVQNEDTLWKIAKKYNTSVDDLLVINDIETQEQIFAGQKLLILKNYIQAEVVEE